MLKYIYDIYTIHNLKDTVCTFLYFHHIHISLLSSSYHMNIYNSTIEPTLLPNEKYKNKFFFILLFVSAHTPICKDNRIVIVCMWQLSMYLYVKYCRMVVARM